MNNEKKIEWKKCRNCSFIQHNSHLRCLQCRNDTFDTIVATGTCKLLTYTILKAPPAEYRNKSSYSLGIVEFKNGLKALGQLTTQKKLSTGMTLNPVYKRVCQDLDGKEVYAYVFEPV